MSVPDEQTLLEESAGLARRLAAESCRVDPATGERCDWCHGFWQVLRLLKLNATPADQAALYREALRALDTGTRAPRILISASADYAMLRQVLAAFDGAARLPEITVLDVCDTPLALNRWYAQRVGVEIVAVRSDILDYRAEAPFDAVCTHSFFGYFTPQSRPRLVETWHTLLRPGGIAVTVNRVRPEVGPAPVTFGAAQAGVLRDAIVPLADRLPPALGLDAAGLAAAAERYAARQRPYPVRSTEEIRELFEGGGFRIEHLSLAPISGEAQHAVRGPTVSAGAEYASVIARRR